MKRGTDRKIFALLYATLSCILFLCCSTNGNEEKYIFNLEYKNDFKIVQLSDIQASTSQECDNAFEKIDKIIYSENPDLIVLVGDNIAPLKDEGVFKRLIIQMEKYNIPWCPVFGNHDGERLFTREGMSKTFSKSKNCIFDRGPTAIDGYGNYVVNLVNNKKIKFSLFFMDSNMYSRYGGGIVAYDGIHKNQVKWYSQTVRYIQCKNGGNIVPSVMFFHVPLPEFNDARKIYEQDNSVGWGTYKDAYDILPENNSGLFDEILRLKSTQAVCCGHCHTNTGDILYKGVHLCYGLKSSEYDYHDKALLGCSLIEITENGEFNIKNKYFE